MPTFKDVVEWLINPQVSKILLLLLIGYLILLWAAIVIWTAKDIISRTNNILLQIVSIILVAVLNIFGLLVYLAIRPSKTLIEKFFEDLEYEALSESARQPERKSKNKKSKKKNKTGQFNI